MSKLKQELKSTKKINFFHLFKIFRWQIVIYWLVSLVIAIISYIIWFSARELMISGTEDVKNYAHRILPAFFKKFKFFLDITWTKEDFLLFSATLITPLVFLLYFSNLQKEKFRIEAEDYVKNSLLDKFRFLPFEEREQRKKEINILVEKDSVIVGKFWNDLYNNIFKLIIRLFLIVISFRHYSYTKRMNNETIFISLVWIFLVNLIGFFLLQKILRNERKRKKELTKENALINKESNKSILIDSMGLTSQYRDKQRSRTKKNQNFFKLLSPLTSLYGIFSEEVINFYPFIVFIFVKEIPYTSLYIFYNFFDTFSKSFKLLIDYGDYISSLARVNNFLLLPQKDDNLSGLKITEKITSIVFKNVYFKYSGEKKQGLENYDKDFNKKNFSYLLGESKDKGTVFYFKQAEGENWILEDYSHDFVKKNINELSGENGTGKSTILYLLLGMLQPTSGEVLIHCRGGKVYNLHKDINLKYWREKTVAYCSHDNLVEEGSTGQKQLTNIEQVITKKKDAQIFCFDEADNGLDKKNQEEFEEKLKALSKGNNVVIYTIKI